ncbi:hypothetical protein DFH27DRAFT_332691 [Peziza echinospora]|nr:hypothetical protein DFH27DRAFT_332691 [Peziza echinospora]
MPPKRPIKPALQQSQSLQPQQQQHHHSIQPADLSSNTEHGAVVGSLGPVYHGGPNLGGINVGFQQPNHQAALQQLHHHHQQQIQHQHQQQQQQQQQQQKQHLKHLAQLKGQSIGGPGPGPPAGSNNNINNNISAAGGSSLAADGGGLLDLKPSNLGTSANTNTLAAPQKLAKTDQPPALSMGEGLQQAGASGAPPPPPPTQQQPQQPPPAATTARKRSRTAKTAAAAASAAASAEGSSTAAAAADQADVTSSAAPAAKRSRTNTPWTPLEEQRLKNMRDSGKSWSEIAKTFPLRTEGSVKKHWYKDMHYAEFGEDETAALLAAIKEYESNKWKVVGQKVGKPAKACEAYAKEHFSGKT